MKDYEPIAKDFYRVYVEDAGGKNFRGEPCPTWAELPYEIKHHWVCVAMRAEQIAHMSYDRAWEILRG